MKTIRLTMGQALVQFLDNQYINYDGEEIKFVEGVAGIFGHGSVLGVGEALTRKDHSLRFYRTNNEQGAGHMAMGFAKQHNRKKILCALSSVGPGAMNMITAAATATANRIPVLFLPGDIFASRQPDPVLQQVEQEHDYTISSNDAFRPVSKYWDRISRPEQLMTASMNAMRVLTDPAVTGAVTLSLPQDTVAESYDYPEEFFVKRVHHIQRRPLSPELEKEIVSKIQTKKRPLILVGGGVRYSEAWDEVKRISEMCNIPIAETQAGKGIIEWNHPNNLGSLGTTGSLAANRIAADTDCLLAIGTRLNDFHTASKWIFRNEALEVIGINVNSMDAYKLNAHPYFADAKLALQSIIKELESNSYKSIYTTEISDEKKIWNEEVEKLYTAESDEVGFMSQTNVIGLLHQHISETAIVVCAGGSIPSDMERIWRTKSMHGYHLEYAYSCMGYEIPAAIGAKLANPDRAVWVFIGDGTYLMYHQEIVMSIAESLKIHICLIDNHGWQCIDNLQTSQGIPRFGCELRFRNSQSDRLDGEYVPINFAMNAKSYGCDTWKATNPAELEKAIKESEKSEKTSLIEIPCLAKSMTDGYETWWRAGTPEVSTYPEVEQAHQIMKKHINEARKF